MKVKQVDGGRCPVCGGAGKLYYDAEGPTFNGNPLDYPVEEFCPSCCDQYPLVDADGDEYTFE